MNTRLPNKVYHREKLLEYMSNPDNPVLMRKELATEVLGFSDGVQIYQHFTPEELTEIEHEALDLRRKCYAARLAKVDDALLKRAASEDGTSADAKLAFQRFEGWSEKQLKEITLDGPMLQMILAVFPPEVAEKLKVALIAKYKELT